MTVSSHFKAMNEGPESGIRFWLENDRNEGDPGWADRYLRQRLTHAIPARKTRGAFGAALPDNLVLFLRGRRISRRATSPLRGAAIHFQPLRE